MKNTLVTLILILVGLSMNAQKVKVKNEIVLIDKVEYMRMKKDKLMSDFYFYSLGENEEELVYAKYVDYDDPNVWSDRVPGRPHLVQYWEIHVAGVDDFFEVDFFGKHIAKMVYNANLIDMVGVVDVEKSKLYASRIGKNHSRRREELQSTPGKVIIIENRNTAPQPVRNGVRVRTGIGSKVGVDIGVGL